jgi:hypothetical protein
MTNYIQVRLRKDTESPPEHEALIRLLLEKDDLPFSLPSYVQWPRGERRMTDRALILMHAGIEHLKATYPQKTGNRDIVGASVDTVESPKTKTATAPEGW